MTPLGSESQIPVGSKQLPALLLVMGNPGQDVRSFLYFRQPLSALTKDMAYLEVGWLC